MNATRILRTIDETMEQLRVLRIEVEREASGEPLAEPIFLTIDEYAERRAVSRSTVARWLRRGLPRDKRGGTVRIPVREADAWKEPEALLREAEMAATRGRR
jgi:excisionase family DNA binding protein